MVGGYQTRRGDKRTQHMRATAHDPATQPGTSTDKEKASPTKVPATATQKSVQALKQQNR